MACIFACSPSPVPTGKTAKEILGNSEYLAFAYGGFRERSRDQSPSVEQIKEDMLILSAMGVKIIRTYNTQLYPHASNTLKAIRQLKAERSGFEMYVMLGAWIECKGAWGPGPDHIRENISGNRAEIDSAIALILRYPDIVKIVAVGNESMVHWAESYFVSPDIILKYVQRLQDMKKTGDLPSTLWVTCSDNFASWGGGSPDYHTEVLTELIKAVDYISLHTYPFHDTHYNPEFWNSPDDSNVGSTIEQSEEAMQRALNYAQSQYHSTVDYVKMLGIQKDVHIGETGWSTSSAGKYGSEGSGAADEYKQAIYYRGIRDWSESQGISCFYFEAFDEQWKDLNDPRASENHFGIINLQGQAKYALWDLVDNNVFSGLQRDGRDISKTFNGNIDSLKAGISALPAKINQP